MSDIQAPLSTSLAELNYSVDNFDGSLTAASWLRDQFSYAFQQFPSEPRLHLSYIRYLVKINEISELEATITVCLSLYPSNSWIILQSVESLIAVRSHLVFEVLARYFPVTEVVDEKRWRLVFNSLLSLTTSAPSYIEFLKSMISNNSNDYYLLSKIGQLYFLQHEYDLSFHALIHASHFDFLRSTSLIILSESALFLDNDSQGCALSMIIAANKLEPRLELFHHICLYSILIQRVEASISIFLSDYHLYLSSWELLHWFNRLPFSIEQGLQISSSLDAYFDLHKHSLDWRWHYHYSIALMLQSRVTEASLVLDSFRSTRSEVSALQSSLRALSHRLTIDVPSLCHPVDWRSDFNPYFIDCRSDVIVLFSGWTGALGYVSDFTISEYFIRLGFNVLILRDPKLKFFSDGLAPSQFPSNSLTELNHYLISRTSGDIYFVGDSISALAAIHHACLIPSDVKVIAFSPVLSKSDYSGLGISHFDSNVQPSTYEDLLVQTRGHQSLIRIEATRNLYPNIFKLLGESTNIDLHVVFAGLNKTDTLVANCLYQKARATLHCQTKSGAHLVSNEFIASDDFKLLLDRINDPFSLTSRFEY